VIYACERVAQQMAGDSELAEKVNGLISTLASG
jgi:hypothetical protein